MRRVGKLLVAAFILTLGVAIAIGAVGFFNARADADALIARADALIAQGRDGEALGATRLAMLIRVQDPGFADHNGLDLWTPGAGITTITQSLAKRVAFDDFQPGIAKLRQTTYAMGLETRLSKTQILALWLDTVEMGRGPDGWITGFFAASEAIFGAPPDQISEAEFLHLIAVLIAPGRYDLMGEDPALDARVARIERLIAGTCTPQGNGDVRLDGCA
ncbi:transglycosylase domain-containing protein [Jannaschia sp. CCS1]|uniref:transglycosylase domain-containing protein n=1 Tax=Jannaschia sp. (strain CCS1) TaxID=290400 RepID=UPI000053C592|nr:transglycosylase domain-containing protein [Jannaschia sp. CCS1]ABD56236.1 glycosyl transferase family 51 [Jannaschia sp. CCS1]